MKWRKLGFDVLDYANVCKYKIYLHRSPTAYAFIFIKHNEDRSAFWSDFSAVIIIELKGTNFQTDYI